MAKSITTSKRDNEKKRINKREEKQKKKEQKKLSGKAGSFDDMIAYVDENGRITSTPPSLTGNRKEEINVDEIIISTPKKEEEEPTVLRGRVEFFNEARGFGFIKDLARVDKYFFHVNNVNGQIGENNIVTFDLERGPKGMTAVNISLEKAAPKVEKNTAVKAEQPLQPQEDITSEAGE